MGTRASLAGRSQASRRSRARYPDNRGQGIPRAFGLNLSFVRHFPVSLFRKSSGRTSLIDRLRSWPTVFRAAILPMRTFNTLGDLYAPDAYACTLPLVRCYNTGPTEHTRSECGAAVPEGHEQSAGRRRQPQRPSCFGLFPTLGGVGLSPAKSFWDIFTMLVPSFRRTRAKLPIGTGKPPGRMIASLTGCWGGSTTRAPGSRATSTQLSHGFKNPPIRAILLDSIYLVWSGWTAVMIRRARIGSGRLLCKVCLWRSSI